MTADLIVPLHPEHPSTRKYPDVTPLYASKAEFTAARNALFQTLESRFPDHFGKQGQPWALGLREELLTAMKFSGYSDCMLRHTLHYYSRSVRYLTNCILSGHGAARLTLSGTPSGSLSRRELIFALTQLSAMLQKKEPAQVQRYRHWALREMVLGLLHGDVDELGLEQAKVRKAVIKRAQLLAQDPEAVAELKLTNRSTGALHPAVYAMPYLPVALHKAFQKRHPNHVTAGKIRKTTPPSQRKTAKGFRAAQSKSVRHPKPAANSPYSPCMPRIEQAAIEKAEPVIIVRKRRTLTVGSTVAAQASH